MLELAIVAFTTFFATVGPLDVALVFAALTGNLSSEAKKKTAVRAIVTASLILIVFSLFGEQILNALGISLAAMRTAGGILLLLIGIEMVFARNSGALSTTEQESAEAESKLDVSVFPLATPLIAGPGSMGAAILLSANQKGHWLGLTVLVLTLLLVLLIAFVCMLLAARIQKRLGLIGMQVITRVMGVLLTALSVQFIFDGIHEAIVAFNLSQAI